MTVVGLLSPYLATKIKHGSVAKDTHINYIHRLHIEIGSHFENSAPRQLLSHIQALSLYASTWCCSDNIFYISNQLDCDCSIDTPIHCLLYIHLWSRQGVYTLIIFQCDYGLCVLCPRASWQTSSYLHSGLNTLDSLSQRESVVSIPDYLPGICCKKTFLGC